MNSKEYRTIEDLVAPVREHLVPEIQQAVEICIRSYMEDEVFNDSWIFGTQLWKNTWNRFEAVARSEDCPFEVYGRGNEYKLKIGTLVVRHHRVDRTTRIPKGAKAVKLAATQLSLFSGEWDTTVDKDNIVIAIDAEIEKGLREVFIGELIPDSVEPKKFRWGNTVPVYLADGIEHEIDESVPMDDIPSEVYLVPEEEIPEVNVLLDRSKEMDTGSEGDK